ncbi:hypothetical protein NEOKW01_1873 [Nematocida sp. AWRm80]|nr:hypothetical protein NEOKW01_1873 [Nematocida sp. AWRm80]
MPDDTGRRQLKELFKADAKVRFAIWKKETKEKEEEASGYIELKTPVKMSGIKKILGHTIILDIPKRDRKEIIEEISITTSTMDGPFFYGEREIKKGGRPRKIPKPKEIEESIPVTAPESPTRVQAHLTEKSPRSLVPDPKQKQGQKSSDKPATKSPRQKSMLVKRDPKKQPKTHVPITPITTSSKTEKKYSSTPKLSPLKTPRSLATKNTLTTTAHTPKRPRNCSTLNTPEPLADPTKTIPKREISTQTVSESIAKEDTFRISIPSRSSAYSSDTGTRTKSWIDCAQGIDPRKISSKQTGKGMEGNIRDLIEDIEETTTRITASGTQSILDNEYTRFITPNTSYIPKRHTKSVLSPVMPDDLFAFNEENDCFELDSRYPITPFPKHSTRNIPITEQSRRKENTERNRSHKETPNTVSTPKNPLATHLNTSMHPSIRHITLPETVTPLETCSKRKPKIVRVSKVLPPERRDDSLGIPAGRGEELSNIEITVQYPKKNTKKDLSSRGLSPSEYSSSNTGINTPMLMSIDPLEYSYGPSSSTLLDTLNKTPPTPEGALSTKTLLLDWDGPMSYGLIVGSSPELSSEEDFPSDRRHTKRSNTHFHR